MLRTPSAERLQEDRELWLIDRRRPRPLHQPCCLHQSHSMEKESCPLRLKYYSRTQEAKEGPFPRLKGHSIKAEMEKPPPHCQALLHVLKYKQSWPQGIVEIAIINSDGAPGGASFSIIVAGLVSHSSNRISKVQVLPPGAPLETHYFKAPQ